MKIQKRLHVCLSPIWLFTMGGLTTLIAGTEMLLLSVLGMFTWCALAITLLVPASVLAWIGFLRWQAGLQAVLGNVDFTCPNCARQGSCLFRCGKCKRLHENLQPSIYGINYVLCLCGKKLPTQNRLGRLQLKKVCANRECSVDLIDADLGREAEYRLAIVGATSSGKSNLKIASLGRFLTFAQRNHIKVTFGDPRQKEAFKISLDLLKAGETVEKTVLEAIPKPLAVTFTKEERRSLLYLYDPAGEAYLSEHNLRDHPLDKYNGFLLVIDPFAEDSVCRFLGVHPKATSLKKHEPADQEASITLSPVLNILERRLRVGVTGKRPVPIAVVVTKVDAEELRPHLKPNRDPAGNPRFGIGFSAFQAELRSPQVRKFLLDAGLVNLVKNLDEGFARVAYFAVSSLGRPYDPDNHTTFQPRGTLAPLLWLLFHTDALSDSDPLIRWFINLHLKLWGKLRGFDGRLQQFLCFGCLFGVLYIIVAAFLWYPLFVFSVCFVQSLLLLALYITLLFMLVGRRFQLWDED